MRDGKLHLGDTFFALLYFLVLVFSCYMLS